MTPMDRLIAAADALADAMQQIAELKERPANLYPADWRDQIAACPDCQRYKDHPVQRGICDTHRRPIYKSQDHDAHETRILGYRCQSIARDALEAYRAAREAVGKPTPPAFATSA